MTTADATPQDRDRAEQPPRLPMAAAIRAVRVLPADELAALAAQRPEAQPTYNDRARVVAARAEARRRGHDPAQNVTVTPAKRPARRKPATAQQ
ncbi:hypothetical protein ACFVH4_06975 [Nocardia ignorata]|uniref:hypothetical protein n=1 Tax=Nocardia ignorata TaxID=145285 RepID=UPI003641CCB9